MAGENKTLDFDVIVQPDSLAGVVTNHYRGWKSSRASWEKQKLELRNYIFATDTSTTTNSEGGQGWKNSTTRPKLTQIRDNLHANYMAALFPHADFFKWEADSKEGADKIKAKVITSYMKNKLQQSHFEQEMSKLVYDYIDYGNAFGEVVYITDYHIDGDGETVVKYVGPKLNRISPLNIVFNVNASHFHATPSIVRDVLSVGQLAKMQVAVAGTTGWIDEAFNRAIDLRSRATGVVGFQDTMIKAGITIDGFGNFYDYLVSGTVEVLTFQGDLYDLDKGELKANHKIIIIDRSYVVYDEPLDAWLGRSNIEHVGWRQRPDNLMAMGPLDNLVGMQYRIDHLENLKADVFDQIAHPIIYEKGEVEDWDFGPGARIYGDVDSDVQFLHPDTTALNADFQIRELEEQMEEMAGAPRQAMGIRTPGEKTAHEVQTLENNAGRIFQHKSSYFDKNFVEPILNQMLASAKANMEATEQIRVLDDDIAVVSFQSITKDDIQAAGRLVPRGSSHFARKAQILQNLNGFLNSQAFQDPAINVHISGFQIAKITQELLDLEGYEGLVVKNIRIAEGAETQQTMTSAEDVVALDASINPEAEALDAAPAEELP